MLSRFAKILAIAFAVVLVSSTLSLAADKPTGTVVAVDEAVVKVKGADGKVYEVKAADVIAENLKTGDVVEYEIVEGMPVKVHKKMPAK